MLWSPIQQHLLLRPHFWPQLQSQLHCLGRCDRHPASSITAISLRKKHVPGHSGCCTAVANRGAYRCARCKDWGAYVQISSQLSERGRIYTAADTPQQAYACKAGKLTLHDLLEVFENIIRWCDQMCFVHRLVTNRSNVLIQPHPQISLILKRLPSRCCGRQQRMSPRACQEGQRITACDLPVWVIWIEAGIIYNQPLFWWTCWGLILQ